jgi:hypothetical protein
METQDTEKALATHVAQDYTQREGGDRRAKNHQHTYFILHSGPSIQSLGSPVARCLRTLYAVLLPTKAKIPSYHQDVIVTDSSLTLTLVSIAE